MKSYAKKMSIKAFDIEASKFVSVIHEADAKELGIMPLDRAEIQCNRTEKKITTVVDTTHTLVGQDQIGLFADILKAIGAKNKEQVWVQASPQPKSVHSIRRKLRGEELKEGEINEIIADIADNKLSEIEASAFLSAVFMRGNSLDEIIATTKALAKGGEKLRLGKGIVVDKHSIGGINGRTSMILVPIVAAAGLLIPKTASRSITSAAGTADCMEVLANVSLSLQQIKKITQKTGGVIAWGGAVDLAPADDKIIKIERPLSLDPEGQIIASVLAKKYCVGAKHVVIDLPVGPEVKIFTVSQAKKLAKKFVLVGKKMGMRIKPVITNGKEPACNVFGSVLETRNALEILEGKEFGFLGQKACRLAGCLLEMSGKAKPEKGFAMAKQILDSGKALQKMQEIVRAQGGKTVSSEQLVPGSLSRTILAKKSGKITEMHVRRFANTARIAGAPSDTGAGVYIHAQKGERVQKGGKLFDIFSNNQQKLDLAHQYARENNPVEIKQ
jgi:AMP phosphorylase